YTSHGILGIIPGRSAFADLNRVLTDAGELIRESAPPVHGTVGILCLVTIGIGLVAVVVAALAVSLAAPAAAGLVLLCLYALPASRCSSRWKATIGTGSGGAAAPPSSDPRPGRRCPPPWSRRRSRSDCSPAPP